jgi:hypothetical protein
MRETIRNIPVVRAIDTLELIHAARRARRGR